MADIRAAKRLRQFFPARFVGALVQLLLGLSIVTGQAETSGTVVFFRSQTDVDPVVLGVGFIAAGLITLVTQNIRIYLAVNLFVFGSYTLIALLGWLLEAAVPPQASILTLGVCLYTLWSFPEGDDVA